MNKRSVLLLLIVMAVAVLALCGYMVMDRMRTDSAKPEISMDAQEITLSVEDPVSAVLQGVTAWDAEDGDVTSSLIVESIYGITEDHTLTVRYAAFDRAGNVAKAERTVRYTDYTSPRFYLNGPLVYEFGDIFEVMEDIGANDIFEGDIRRRIKATILTDAITVTEEGIHQVQFRVTNSLGDSVQIVLPVEVYPADSYEAELTLTDYMIYLPVGADFKEEDYLQEFSYVGHTLELDRALPEGMKLRTAGRVNTEEPGVYTLSYTATYEVNGQSYTGYTKLVVIVEG